LAIIVFRILAISIGQESFFLNHCRAPSPDVLVICNSETFGEQSNTTRLWRDGSRRWEAYSCSIYKKRKGKQVCHAQVFL